jgi:ParB family chromosome partitioning protein
MKRISQSGGLDMDAMYEILEEEKPNQREQIKIRADKIAQYFPSDFTPKQKVELIEKLVKEWHEKQEYIKQESLGNSRGESKISEWR